MLGVFILCFASVANATNEHPAKAEHFSMLELNRRLSALILEKYPNAHIDSDVFLITACNLQSMKDASINSSIKPRPDSADFILRLSVGVDLPQTQHMLFTPYPHIVSKTTSGNDMILR